MKLTARIVLSIAVALVISGCAVQALPAGPTPTPTPAPAADLEFIEFYSPM